MPEVSLMLYYGILGRKSPMSKGRGMVQLKGIPLLPLKCSEIPAHPVSEAFLMPAGGTDNLHYVTAPCFIRPILVYISLLVSLLPSDQPTHQWYQLCLMHICPLGPTVSGRLATEVVFTYKWMDCWVDNWVNKITFWPMLYNLNLIYWS